MILTTNTIEAVSLLPLLATQSALTNDQKQALRDELDTDPTLRGYKQQDGTFKPVSDLLRLLNLTYGAVNPNAQGRVAKTLLTQGELVVLTSQMQGKRAAALLSGQAIPDAIIYIIDVLLPSVSKQQSMLLADVQVQEIVGILQQSGLLSADDVTALTTAPDPAWTATVLMPSRASVVLETPGAVLDGYDLQAALATPQEG